MLEKHLEKLKDFVGVVQHGSIRAYAVRSKLAQPGVSRNIQTLESALETQLLIRGQQGVNLTATGSILFEYARDILDETQIIEERILDLDRESFEGSLTLGSYSSIASYLLPEFVKFANRRQHRIQFNIKTNTSVNLIEALKAGSVDLVITVDPPAVAMLSHELLFADVFSCFRVAGAETPWKERPCIIVPMARFGATNLAEYCALAKILSRNIFCCDDFETVKAMIESGVGCGILPLRVATPRVESGNLVEMRDLPKLHRFGEHRISLSVRKHRSDDRKIRWVAQHLESFLKA